MGSWGDCPIAQGGREGSIPTYGCPNTHVDGGEVWESPNAKSVTATVCQQKKA